MTLGELVRSLQYLTMLVWPVQSLGDMVASGQRAAVSAARVWNVLKEEPTVSDRPHPHALPPGRGSITFENVRFGYQPDRPVLNDYRLEVPAGRSVALVGSTGSGKSTVARLLPRFYDANAGRILIDGADIRESASGTFAATSASSSKTRSCSPTRSATTSPTAASTPKTATSSAPPAWPTPPSSSSRCATATKHRR